MTFLIVTWNPKPSTTHWTDGWSVNYCHDITCSPFIFSPTFGGWEDQHEKIVSSSIEIICAINFSVKMMKDLWPPRVRMLCFPCFRIFHWYRGRFALMMWYLSFFLQARRRQPAPGDVDRLRQWTEKKAFWTSTKSIFTVILQDTMKQPIYKQGEAFIK